MSLIITGVLDGPLTGGLPKAVEIFVTADIADLSVYGVGSANNGGGSDGEEFTFPSVAAEAGTYIYISSEVPGFTEFMGFTPDYTAGALSVNGDDAIEVFQNGAVIDRFGDINVDGTGQPWEYLDGWAARNPGAVASPDFDITQWSFSGPNAFDNQASNATAATPFPTASFDDVVATPTFVINEVDADQDGTDSAEFIEIYDGGIGNASLDGLTVVLYNGNGDAAYDTISLDGLSTNADGFFVIGSANVPNVDLVEFTTNGLQNGADAVALYDGPAPAAATTDNLLDAVVYGTNDADDTELLTALGQTVQANESANGNSIGDAVARQPDATGDFIAQAPTPGTSNTIEPPAEITLISEIQGAVGTDNLAQVGVDDRSALEGETVTVRAIVTADFQNGLFGSMGDLDGFYIQEEEVDYDFNDLSSEGIFIFDGNAPLVDVNVGDLVEITGVVTENFGQTQITATTTAVLDTDQMLPDAVEVTFPTANIMQDDDGNYVANLEAYEGMLVNVAQDMTVSELFNLDRFGEYTVSADGRPVQFTQDNAPDVAGFEQHRQDIAAAKIVLDDGLAGQNPDVLNIIDGNDGVLTADDAFRMGDTISSIQGVVSYGFDEFRINAAEGDYQQANPRPETPDELGGNFKVASLNVLNYFTTIDEPGVTTDNGSDPRGADSLEEFERQADKLVNAIVAIDAAVLGLVEIENDFAGDTFAIKDIVDRVNAELGSEVYAFVDPGQEFVGGDAISNGLIYKVDEVGLNGDMAILETFEGRDFIDPLDAGRGLNRPAIAQTFEDLDTGQTITVSVNHFKSKGSLSGLEADEAQGDGQGNNNATRTEAADILAAWLNSDPTGQGSENTLILGDLNAYAKEDPLTVLADAGFTDLAAAELGDAAYSFVFDGQIGTLDYALANDALADNVVGVTEWHINADEADALDYNLDFGRDPALFDGDSPNRNSDHDPVIVSFQFDPVYNQVAGTNGRDFLFGTEGRDDIDGKKGGDFIFAGGGDDLISGGRGRDKILAGSGDDEIDAGRGSDLVIAGAGDDTIISGNGKRDLSWGGHGADTFVFSAAFAENGSRDRTTILDFDVTEDIIDLGGAEIANVREAGGSVRITLEGGHDRIDLIGVFEFDDIVFANDFVFV
ncbi:ExeM/NucH family extracellular endonuclease [Roseobacter sp. CCS2]|uniref:ExeM/NucH family extracellular endonuclease n=1 Tax=Roseobacter sp. CCS2 TaxID=391593 RepID=UPI0000F3F759|nr:ExeM/NucH family extracellular endonuclease [Roseobacter sp. CCS2]EBA10599.1 extracellular nuclease [Roseobacter sp. CCS2]